MMSPETSENRRLIVLDRIPSAVWLEEATRRLLLERQSNSYDRVSNESSHKATWRLSVVDLKASESKEDSHRQCKYNLEEENTVRQCFPEKPERISSFTLKGILRFLVEKTRGQLMPGRRPSPKGDQDVGADNGHLYCDVIDFHPRTVLSLMQHANAREYPSSLNA